LFSESIFVDIRESELFDPSLNIPITKRAMMYILHSIKKLNPLKIRNKQGKMLNLSTRMPSKSELLSNLDSSINYKLILKHYKLSSKLRIILTIFGQNLALS